MKTAFFSRVGIVTALAIVVFLFRPADGATLLVTNNNDSGAGSLRQAILDNENLGGNNTIVFSNVMGTITLTTGELLISKYVTILGPGPANLAVDGNAAGRVFHISSSNNLANAFISGMTLSNGAVSGTFGGNFADVGGGICNYHSTLTLSNCAVIANSGGFGPGGGIYNDGSADGSSIDATLTIIKSTISNNSVTNLGGGIYNYGSQGTAFISIVQSTIGGNSAYGSGDAGGGIFNNGNSGNAYLSISDSTFSGNSANSEGGALYNGGAGSGIGQLTVVACTFASNSAVVGGAIFNDGSGATVTLTDTILRAGAMGGTIVNSSTNVVVSHGYNLSSDNGGGVLTNATDQINKDPLLGPLADNGGPTFTHALLPGSPALDKGTSFGLTTDQRGQARPVDFLSIPNAVGGDGSDIGSFEVGRPMLAIQTSGNSVVLSWPTNYYSDFNLQSSTNIASSNSWIGAAGSAIVISNQYLQTNGPISGDLFFRLREN